MEAVPTYYTHKQNHTIMKTKATFFMLWAFLLLTVNIFAQAPQKFNYQAVIRDDAGNIVPDQTVGIKISILQGAVYGTVVYSETHSPTTNSFGLVTLEIGGGATSDDFGAIDWGGDPYFLKVEMDATGGTTYTEMGTTQLLSVPYALFAENATDKDDADSDPANELISAAILNGTSLEIADAGGTKTVDLYSLVNDADHDPSNEFQDLTLSDNTLSLTNSGSNMDLSAYLDNTNYWGGNSDTIYYMGGNVGIGTTSPQGKLEVQGDGLEVPDEPLFEVKRKDGQTVFAVYPEGVRIYVEDIQDSKGTKGGFAIGGIRPGKGITNEYFRVTPDSIRMYVEKDTVTTKGTKGGFAIGGISPVKGVVDEYFHVSSDSVRIYVEDELDPIKGTKGGFAVGGIRPVKGITNEYLRVTPDSVRIYVEKDDTKGTKGGFAIGGISPLKGIDEEYLRVSPDSVRVYINDNPATKGTKGGFAIGGFSPLKGLTGDYMNVSGKSTAEIIDPSDARVLWYPNKEAFLTGRVLIESPDSVGTNSMATGFESRAIGDWSQALGYKAIARGDYSTAIGKNAIANETSSFSFGDEATAKGENSFSLGQWAIANNAESYAFGKGATADGYRSFAFGSAGIDSAGVTTGVAHAIGDYSFAIGQGSISSGFGSFTFGLADTASGSYSTAIGYKTSASEYYSTAMGYLTMASGKSSTAMGYWTTASGQYSTSIGYYTIANKEASIALGYQTTASGNSSVAIGKNTIASGGVSTAMGMGSTASEGGSTAIGYYTTASGEYSTSMGWYTTASGKTSTAMGAWTMASGQYSTAMGYHTTASGFNSTAIGNSTTASGSASTAMGVLTTASGSASTAMGRGIEAEGDYVVAISLNDDQSGTVVSQDNTMSIMGGKVGIATTTPQGTLDVNGSIYQRGTLLLADFVFEDEYELESIEEHSSYMWKNKHLPAVPISSKDEHGNDVVEWGARNRGILEELEKSHVYIDQLNTALKEQQATIEELKQEIEKLKKR